MKKRWARHCNSIEAPVSNSSITHYSLNCIKCSSAILWESRVIISGIIFWAAIKPPTVAWPEHPTYCKHHPTNMNFYLSLSAIETSTLTTSMPLSLWGLSSASAGISSQTSVGCAPSHTNACSQFNPFQKLKCCRCYKPEIKHKMLEALHPSRERNRINISNLLVKR